MLSLLQSDLEWPHPLQFSRKYVQIILLVDCMTQISFALLLIL